MPNLRVLLVLLLLPFAALSQSSALPPGPEPRRPVELSGYYSLGFEFHYRPSADPEVIETVGLQGEWVRWKVRPGVDLRAFGNTDAVHGGLVGPTVAFVWAGLRPYAEALFGSNSISVTPSTNQPTTKQGTTSEVVLGVDVDITEHTRWRLLEFSQGVFTGVPDAYPRTLSSGIVLHF